MDLENVERLFDEYAQEPVLYNCAIEELVKMLISDVSVSNSTEEAYNLFIKITNLCNITKL